MAVIPSVLRLVCALLLTIVALASADAATSPPVATGHSTASLITDTDTVAAGQSFNAALVLRLALGWHTYWQNPGDAGVAPAVTLPPDARATAGPILWPLPQKASEGPLTTYAYQGEVVLPFRITPQSAPLPLQVHAEWLVCRDLCVPEQADLTISLPAGQPAASGQSAVIAAALAQTPRPSTFTAAFSTDGQLHVSGPGLPGGIRRMAFFPSDDGVVNTTGFAAVTDDGGGITAPVSLGTHASSTNPLPGVIALTDGAGVTTAYSVTATPGYAPPQVQQSVAILLLLALAGGLLLNLMPCVFPILAMKAMALARMSGAQARAIRTEAASYVAGVITAFVALGGALLVLRGAGYGVGWGFQFQSVGFVTAIAWLLFATGLNMSGVFSFGESITGTGSGLAGRGGHAGSFFTGLLAVVVATPCTASFMAAAIAGALAEPAPAALLVFAALGLGLALPYAAIAAVPRLAKVLPRPGRWMLILRQALAFPMYGATAWLVWVASQQAGASAVLLVGTGLVILGFGAWLLGMAQTASTTWGRRAGYSLTALCAACIAGLLATGASPAASEPSEPYSAARLAQLRTEGRPVFVNMTAAWCLSCLVNERLALSPAPVQRAFAQAHVAYLKGDWTRQDPSISDFLHANGRDGVPLYIYYPPGRPAVVLPQLLTQSTLLDQFAHAGG